MLLVKTKLDLSSIEGIGIFADQDIPEDTVVWTFDPTVDLVLTSEAIEALDENCRSQVQKYAYEHKKGCYVLCGDDARFFNHYDNPNCLDYAVEGQEHGYTVADRDIFKGEELTCDYELLGSDNAPLLDFQVILPQKA